MQFGKCWGIFLGLLLMGTAAARADAALKVHWVFRNYYTSENAADVELWLSLSDRTDLEFVGFDHGEASEVPESQHSAVQSWWSGHGRRYQALVEDGYLRVLEQDVTDSQTSSGHPTLSPEFIVVKKLPITGKVLVVGPSQTQTAKELFRRTLSLKKTRLHGDDV